MEEKKNGGSILSSIGWISVALLFITLMPPLFMFFPICIGIVLRRDYQEQKQEGLAMIILGVIGALVGFLLAMYVNLKVL
ncbi:hypothetical protein H9635_17315 [Solibacillus sp. A46]|uniref:DUF4190 domain-containing protein n=1 Tax=Solibacillus faecavium TaxID=2762221 RepID=A0ABR8Y2Q4_9BACL|nr:hypothetical protein [Solibacillus faecavium]MBD8038507.1 hypothetical protein [Solibacillus faecavium]